MGSPSERISESGEIAWHTRATLWGTTRWNRDATAYTPLRFPGQYFDAETALHDILLRAPDIDCLVRRHLGGAGEGPECRGG